jgi:hypothetical protein
MSKGEHNVVIYVKEAEKEFSITARKPSAELSKVTKYMKWLGYTSITLAEGLDEDQAKKLKNDKYSEYERKG